MKERREKGMGGMGVILRLPCRPIRTSWVRQQPRLSPSCALSRRPVIEITAIHACTADSGFEDRNANGSTRECTRGTFDRYWRLLVCIVPKINRRWYDT